MEEISEIITTTQRLLAEERAETEMFNDRLTLEEEFSEFERSRHVAEYFRHQAELDRKFNEDVEKAISQY
ncbi:hypothetical protein [Solemya elarraichensis gill symbiont]|uniref:Uncharacterized protein n=1 Tax=Solemya elarraichensis gill symbiont TaxID=1918949 RepID=A0A1T2L0D6_9GAMM|nr:hypothetical protein [Solemya elarraichensis gill symbiont]OOZ38541.1 hypothetical protein BOW52_08370 [Solemya elarraichensis gill symbiont]